MAAPLELAALCGRTPSTCLRPALVSVDDIRRAGRWSTRDLAAMAMKSWQKYAKDSQSLASRSMIVAVDRGKFTNRVIRITVYSVLDIASGQFH